MAYTLLSILLIGMFFMGGIVHLLAWVQICTVLEFLGHIYEPWTFRKYKNGLTKTLYEYKRFQVAEKKTLNWWWAFWAGLWSVGLGLVGLVILGVIYSH